MHVRYTYRFVKGALRLHVWTMSVCDRIIAHKLTRTFTTESCLWFRVSESNEMDQR